MTLLFTADMPLLYQLLRRSHYSMSYCRYANTESATANIPLLNPLLQTCCYCISYYRHAATADIALLNQLLQKFRY